jgi:hypothetical protein
MVFGSCFEKDLVALFQGDACRASLFKEWGTYRDGKIEHSKSDTWESMLQQGIHPLPPEPCVTVGVVPRKLGIGCGQLGSPRFKSNKSPLPEVLDFAGN